MSKVERPIIGHYASYQSEIRRELDSLREVGDSVMTRAFMCPKCSHSKVLALYNEHKDVITCCCYRCSHWWDEEPDDKKKPQIRDEKQWKNQPTESKSFLSYLKSTLTRILFRS
jgi:ribosomal protein S27AE